MVSASILNYEKILFIKHTSQSKWFFTTGNLYLHNLTTLSRATKQFTFSSEEMQFFCKPPTNNIFFPF